MDSNTNNDTQNKNGGAKFSVPAFLLLLAIGWPFGIFLWAMAWYGLWCGMPCTDGPWSSSGNESLLAIVLLQSGPCFALPILAMPWRLWTRLLSIAVATPVVAILGGIAITHAAQWYI